MKYILWTAALLNLFTTQARAVSGHESHGGAGVVLDPSKLSSDDKAGSVEVFDKLEYDKEFLVQDQEEFKTFISPKLDILKSKLPRTGRFLEQIMIRGISPRWYFVKYGLKPVSDASDTTKLILSFDRVQIAVNDGLKVQIQEDFWKGLEPRSRAFLLMHEALRSAIGIDFFQTSDIVKSVTSLLLNQNLQTFAAQSIAEELTQVLAPCRKGAINSVLFDLVFADSHYQPKTEAGWEDVSVLEDGLTPTSCAFDGDRCAFRDTRTGTIWSMISPDKSTAATLNYEQAGLACKRINGFAGYYSWKLPSFSQLNDFITKANDLTKNFPEFGNINNALWSRTKPQDDPWNFFVDFKPVSDLDAWGVHVASGQIRSINRMAEIPYLCVNDAIAGWEEATTNASGDQSKKCADTSDQCSFKDLTTGLTWSEPGPVYTKRYKGLRRIDDLGFVSQQVAVTGCETLIWNGIEGWRLPSQRDIQDAKRDGILSLILSNEAFGNLEGTFWFDGSGDSQSHAAAFKTASKNTPRAPASAARYVCIHD